MLWSYYIGVIAFLRDHFDLHASHLTLSGISAGCSSALIIFLDLTIEQGFEFGLEWDRLFGSRWLRFWLMRTSETLRMIMRKFASFGVSDKFIAAQYAKFGGHQCLYLGVTSLDFTALNVSHSLLSGFSSLQEMVYAALCSMRILPFFRSLGFYNGRFCCDGAVSANFSIPSRYTTPQNRSKVLRIGVLSSELVDADVCPSTNFAMTEFVVSGDLKANVGRFEKGYRDAAKLSDLVSGYVEKGLVWRSAVWTDPTAICEEEWGRHVDEKIARWSESISAHMQRCEAVEEKK